MATVLLLPLATDAARALAGLDEPASWGLKPAAPQPPEPEDAQPVRPSAPSARVPLGPGRAPFPGEGAGHGDGGPAGVQGPSAIAEFGVRLDQRQLAAVRAFLSPTTGRLTPPSWASMHRILLGIDPDALHRAVRDFTASRHPPQDALAIDGKSAPLHRPGGADHRGMFLAAVAHGAGVAAGQIASDGAGGESLVA